MTKCNKFHGKTWLWESKYLLFLNVFVICVSYQSNVDQIYVSLNVQTVNIRKRCLFTCKQGCFMLYGLGCQ